MGRKLKRGTADDLRSGKHETHRGGRALLNYRLLNRLTQQQLADKVGCVRGTIALIETGRTHPSVPLAMKLGEALKVNWVNFFPEEDYK